MISDRKNWRRFISCASKCKSRRANSTIVWPISSPRKPLNSRLSILNFSITSAVSPSPFTAPTRWPRNLRRTRRYSAIIAKALADRLAEAFAEYLHQQARIAWGFGRNENLSHADLLREKYRGIRPAAGYPPARIMPKANLVRFAASGT